MNKKVILFVLAMIGIVFFVWLYLSLKCSHSWGFQSYGWGGNSGKCINAGCNIIKIKEIDDPKLIDEEGYYYICIP